MNTPINYNTITMRTNNLCDSIIIMQILLNQEEEEERRGEREIEIRNYRKKVIVEEIEKRMVSIVGDLEWIVNVRENIYDIGLNKKEREIVINVIEEIYKRLAAIEKWLVEKINIMVEKEVLYQRMKLDKL